MIVNNPIADRLREERDQYRLVLRKIDQLLDVPADMRGRDWYRQLDEAHGEAKGVLGLAPKPIQVQQVAIGSRPNLDAQVGE